MRLFFRPSMRGYRAVLLFAILLLLSLSLEAFAQFKMVPTIALKGGKVVTMKGDVIEGGTVLIKKGKIVAVGKLDKFPMGTRTIDVKGMTILPGFIDAWGKIVRSNRSGAKAFSKVVDAVDPYNIDTWKEALENGVTAVYLGTGHTGSFTGQGAVLRLLPEAPSSDRFIREEAGLCCALGLAGRQTFYARIREVNSFEKLLKKTKDYQESLDDYEEELAEYLEKIEERKKKKEKEEKKEDKKVDKEKDKKEKGKEEKKEKKENEKGEEDKEKEKKRKKKKDGTGFAVRDRKKPEEKKKLEEKKKDDNKKEEKKEDELKKPKRPVFNAHQDRIAKALKGEIPVRIEVHRASEILSLLELQEKYPMDLVLEGCTEAYLVADAIAKAGVPVILGPTLRSGLYESNQYSRHNPRSAAILKKAGVKVVLGSGDTLAGASRFVAFNAAQAASYGLSREDALLGITRHAAEVLGIGDRIGTIEKGKDADIVVMDGDPLSSHGKIHSVYVAGKKVYSQSKKDSKK